MHEIFQPKIRIRNKRVRLCDKALQRGVVKFSDASRVWTLQSSDGTSLLYAMPAKKWRRGMLVTGAARLDGWWLLITKMLVGAAAYCPSILALWPISGRPPGAESYLLEKAMLWRKRERHI